MKDRHVLEESLLLATGIGLYTQINAFSFSLAISLHLIKGFITPYKPCLTITLNPH